MGTVKILERLAKGEKSSNEYTRRNFDQGLEAARALSKALNGGDRNNIMLGFLDGLVREHRYLQSEMVWMLLTILAELASPDLVNRTDARNEYAIKACADLREALKDRLPLA